MFRNAEKEKPASAVYCRKVSFAVSNSLNQWFSTWVRTNP